MHRVKRPLLLTDDTDKAGAGRLNQHNLPIDGVIGRVVVDS
jgi:hypothetical protein